MTTLLTVAEFAEAKKLHPQTVYQAVSEGRLLHERHGRAIRIPEDAVIEPIEKGSPIAVDRRQKTSTPRTSTTKSSTKPKKWYWEEPGYRQPSRSTGGAS